MVDRPFVTPKDAKILERDPRKQKKNDQSSSSTAGHSEEHSSRLEEESNHCEEKFISQATSNTKSELAQVLFALEQRDPATNGMKCKNFCDTVHVDKKWFSMTKDWVSCVCAPDEATLHRTTMSN